MKVIMNGIAIMLIIFVSGWLLYYAKHNHDPMGNQIDAEKTYMLVGCGIGTVIGITVPKIKKKEKTWLQK